MNSIRDKIQAYIDVYDGTEKAYEEMAEPFEALFHDDFTHTMDGNSINKHQMRDIVKTFLSTGSKVELLLFKPLDDETFKVKLHVVNKLADLKSHSKATVRDGKIVRLGAYEDAKQTYSKWNKLVGLTEVKQNLECFLELQNDKSLGLGGIEDAFDRLFYDNLSAEIHKFKLQKRGLRTTSSDSFSLARFKLEMCEIMDENHLEVKVTVIGDGCRGEGSRLAQDVWHDIITVKDATIVMIEPYDNTQKLASSVDVLACSLVCQ